MLHLNLFHNEQKTHQHPLTSGLGLQWERVQLAFTARSNGKIMWLINSAKEVMISPLSFLMVCLLVCQ